MACENYPTPQSTQDFDTNSKVVNEIVTLNAFETTSSASDGETKRTLKGIEALYLQTPLNGGVWAAGIEFNAYNQYMVFSGTPYKPKFTTTLPYTSTATPDLNFVEPFSDVNTSNIGDFSALYFDSVLDLQSTTLNLSIGQGVIIKERDSKLFVVTNDTPNGYDKIDIDGTLTATYSLVNQITDIAFGLNNDDTDEEAALTAFFNSEYRTLFLKGTGSGNNYKSSKTIQVASDKEIFWGDVTLESITQVDQGSVISFADNTVVYNPKVNGGGPSLIVGSSGQNGYGAVGKVTLYNPEASDCARGISSPYDGGKGIQSESTSGADVTIFNMTATNCHMAVSSRKEGATGTGNHLKVYGLKAINCNHVMFSGQANVNTLDPLVYSVIMTGVEADSCGALDALPEANAGLFLFNRAANVSITDVFMSGPTKIEGVFRGRTRNTTCSSIRVSGDYNSIVNLDPTTLYAPDTSLTVNCQYDFEVLGSADYLYFSDITDSTFPNRFANNSTFNFNITTDVNTRTVTAATRNGDSRMSVQLDNKVVKALAAGFNARYPTMASASNGYTIDDATTLNSPVNGGIDMSSAAGIIIDGLFETVNLSQTSTPVFRPVNDNQATFGSAANRPKEIFAVSGTINTSDGTEKTEPKVINDNILDVWGDVEIIMFQWLASIEEKGEDKARWHYGVIAQKLRDAFSNRGLDGTRYGLLCYDEWEEEVDGKMVTRNRWGIRPDQCLWLEAAYQRRKSSRLEERIEAIELKLQ